MEESLELALEIVAILRKASTKDVAEDVFVHISQIWQQNIADEDIDEEDHVDYIDDFDLFLKK